jgi:hypothetical protein
LIINNNAAMLGVAVVLHLVTNEDTVANFVVTRFIDTLTGIEIKH